MRAEFTLSSPIERTPRVLQVSSMFDVPVSEKLAFSQAVSLPVEERAWNVGLLVGPSGAGKSSMARHLWPEQTGAQRPWTGRALVDDFPAGLGIKDVVGLLTAVGLSSPPAWIRPYGTLSNGEAFRADMARALAEPGDPVVIDEFTSVVDRQVAKVASHAVQKAVRRAGRRLVAVTCHYDVTDWLQPDWVFDVAAGSFEWRSVQPRPALELHIHPGGRELWPVFRRHHYLSADLHPTARCHLALVEGRPVAFTSYLHFPHPTVRNLKMAHRIVVLPDWQGLGIAGRVSEWLGEHLYGQGMRYRIATAHPGLVAYMASSPRWRSVGRPRGVRSGRTAKKRTAQQTDPRSLLVRSFEYAPQPSTPAQPAGGRKRPS